mgnify:CR=1 FL=1
MNLESEEKRKFAALEWDLTCAYKTIEYAIDPSTALQLIWPVLLAWRPANTTTQYGMCGFLIYYWTYRLPEIAELFQLS